MKELEKVFAMFRRHWEGFTDTRSPASNRLTYSLVDGLASAFSVFYLQCPSFLEYQRLLKSDKGRNNLPQLFGIVSTPSDPQIRNILDGRSETELAQNFWDVYELLESSSVLDEYRVLGEKTLIALDGSTNLSSKNIQCEHCLRRTDKNGTEHYYHSALNALVVHPNKSEVIALPPEPISNVDGTEKQDCERKATKRWLEKHHNHFKAGTVVFIADDLSANQPMIELVREVYRQDFVFTCKDSSHKAIAEQVASMRKSGDLHVKTQRKWNGRHGELYQWEYSNEMVTSWGEKGVPVNWFALRVRHEITNKELYYNSWITSITASDWNIEELCQIGRARWKIENEGFNILKRNGYHLEHNFGHGKAGLADYLNTLNMLAFLVHTYQALTGRIYQALRAKLKRQATLIRDMQTLLRYMVFESWEDLCRFMFAGLEMVYPP